MRERLSHVKPRTLFGVVLVVLLVVTSCSGGGLPEHVSFTGVDANLWRGPEHCDWDGTWFIQINSEQFPVETEGDWPAYVRDPSEIGLFHYAAESNLDAEVPESAARIGVSDDGYELWFDPDDETHIYLVHEEQVEAWALATDYFGCA